MINVFVSNATFFYPLETSENRTVFCFQGVEKWCIGNEWVNVFLTYFFLLCSTDIDDYADGNRS